MKILLITIAIVFTIGFILELVFRTIKANDTDPDLGRDQEEEE